MKKIKTKLIWLAGITVSIVVIFLLISNSLRIDVGNILIGIAAIGLVYVLYQYIEHKKQPQKIVNVSIKAKLTAPMIKINRYRFHIEVEHKIIDRNQTHIVKAEELDIKFREKDHPDMYKWCFDYATDKLQEHVHNAEVKYPDANVSYSPVPIINALEKI